MPTDAFSVPLQSALGMMQMLEDTLIEHAHTKPLLPSQLIRYREVQVPDGRYSFARTETIPKYPHLATTAITLVSADAPLHRKDLIKYNISQPSPFCIPGRSKTSGK